MVVTLVSPHNEYGGPVRVAVNQAKALTDMGHQVTIAGAYRGFEHPPTQLEGVTAKLFPARNILPGSGFAGLTSPRLWRWFARHGSRFDVVHIHAARDLVTLPLAGIAALKHSRYVLQPHGMIDPSDRPMSKPLDTLLTVPALSRALRVFYLNERERKDIASVAAGRPVNLAELPNGVPTAECTVQHWDEKEVEVLYLARLAPRKRPTMFVEAAQALSADYPDVKFALVGPDESEGEAVSRHILQARECGTTISWEGPIPASETIARMTQAAMYVLPAIDEPYPMAVLEAMSVGLPVVVTDTCGLAEFISESDAGIIIDHHKESLVNAIRDLLADPVAARSKGGRGRDAVRTSRDMKSIARRLEDAYSSVVAPPAR